MSNNHPNRRQVRMPARLVDELMLALDQALARIEILDPDPAVVTRQVYDYGGRVLAEARKRLQAQLTPSPQSKQE